MAVHVDRTEALESFRAVLIKFAESAEIALMEAESDMNSTLHWLEAEQRPFWKREIRRRDDALHQAKLKLNERKLYKDPSGAQQSFIDEQKAVDRAQAKLVEAEEKAAATDRWVRKLQVERLTFKGQTMKLATFLSNEVKNANVSIARLVELIEQYSQLSGPDAPVMKVEGP